MATAKTEIEWSYSPLDFFEATHRRETVDYTLVADAGKVLVALTAPSDPIDVELQKRIRKDVENLFRLQQLLVHRPFQVDEPAKVCQHGTDGRKSIFVTLRGVVLPMGPVHLRIQIPHDASGKLIKDTKAERIAEHTKFINSVMPKVGSSPTLNALLGSYNAAVNHPANELGHLYEICDALTMHYGTMHKALRKLPSIGQDWSRLGYLANKAPLKEGRHGGLHLKLRHASEAELDEARKIARRLIEAFSNQL